MRHRPSFSEFVELARGHTVVPVYRQLVGDTLTPVTAFCLIREGDRAFLFESVVGGEKIGRYSFVGSGPFRLFEASGNAIREREANGEWKESTHPDPLRKLEELIANGSAPHVPGLPRFCGGAVGYAGYDTIRYVERLPNAPPDDRHIPDLSFAFYDRMVIFDHITKTISAVVHAHITGESEAELRAAYDEACGRVDELVTRLQRGTAELKLTDIDPTAGVRRERGKEVGLPAGYICILSFWEFV
jgi:anthranilate synthase component 1